MPWKTERREATVRLVEGKRTVEIPDDFVLVGERIEIRQEKDGMIFIAPASPEGWKALRRFSPFGDEDDDDARDE